MSKGYFAIGLVRCKSSVNYGTALRSAVAFGCDLIEMVGARFYTQSSDVSTSWRKIPVLQCDEPQIPFDCVPVAVELGGTDLRDYTHPVRAIYFFGPEDGSLSKAVSERCRDRITIPGLYCLNLATAVSIVLYDRESKRRTMALPESLSRKAASR